MYVFTWFSIFLLFDTLSFDGLVGADLYSHGFEEKKAVSLRFSNELCSRKAV